MKSALRNLTLLLSLLPLVQVHGRRVRNTESNGISVLGDFNHESSFPRFPETIANVTVTVGRDALLACVVDNLRGFKVAWVRVDTQTILSIHHNVITQNPRISLSYNDHRSWYLHIKNVQEADRGWYMCQVNTDPMRSRQGYLQVVVPPSIVDRETSSDMVVLESTNVSLTCKATGYPEPYVMWRREDGENYRYNGENVNVVDGEVLFITKVSRLHMANYLCIASNGVPPSISKRVQLRVQFPPMLTIPNQLEGAYIGQDVALECHTEAFPTSINYWTTERGDMIISGSDKYEAVSMDSGYKKYMMLKIRNVGPGDFGSYKCVAKNSLGETDGVIKLEEIPAPTTVRTTTHFPTMPPKKKGRGRVGGDRLGRGGGVGGGSDLNRVSSSDKTSDDDSNPEYDYDGEFTLPSNRPPAIQDLPGAFSGSAQLPVPCRFLLIALLVLVCLR
ncbi:PREDICTED: lachesin-like isoform X3 [Nicrophorus vespilloides]|uniref:Lachesin-like isoform X3 n=1 Tax=Nicrophorus vespilloides TaxID=110193 RepID=A0ABM1N4Q6_NICVS|nr:PREDICTED: lachesin-like isoform X3 [Nicrophorus vespilloides]